MVLIRNESIVISWKWFEFPVSIQNFSMNEDSKVATYEYAGRNGAEHERVLNYRKFSLSWIFSTDSGNRPPYYYAQQLRARNDNAPWEFFHPVFGSFQCIMRSLKISEDGDSNEVLGPGNNIFPNYSFDIEFWETSDPSQVTISDDLLSLYPAIDIKPPSDLYEQTLKYKTVLELYWAIVNGQIIPWTDPIRHAEWQQYDYAFRKEAYDLWLLYPNGLENEEISNPGSREYIVVSGDYWIKIARQFWIPFPALFEANRWRQVRTTPRSTEWLYWKSADRLRPWDSLIIPDWN